MGVPVPQMNADMSSVDQAWAETFLSSLRTISPPERRKHASVYNYWLTIRAGREFPPIRDLDPLEISDAGPFSVLLEMIGGGEDAEIRHVGHAIGGGLKSEKISEAPHASLLSCIATRLPLVAGCRDAIAFEDDVETAEGKKRCWVTLLPFSATGTWIDYVYGFVSLEGASAEEPPEETAAELEGDAEQRFADEAPEPAEELAGAEAEEETVEEAADEIVLEPLELAEIAEPEAVSAAIESAFEPVPGIKPTFSEKFFEKLATVGGFYGRPVEIELDMETAKLEEWEGGATAPLAEPHSSENVASAEPPPPDELPSPVEPNPIPTPEETLQSKLTDVRAKADEARQAKLRANSALYEGLSAAYDFALDAEDSPEEYLKLVQAEGLKIQLRSPMRPVAKLAFDGMCDDMTIQQLEAVLAWAFDEELPRGTLAERIEAAGGIGPILSGQAKAA
jgi:hypothetical protein